MLASFLIHSSDAYFEIILKINVIKTNTFAGNTKLGI